MNKDKLRYLTRTAMLLALTIVFQSLGRFIPLGPNSMYIVGPLVNACLLISTGLVGIYSGTVISILTPFGAILTGATMPLPLAPFVALGNFALVLLFYVFRKKKVIGLITGAIAKFLVIYGSLLTIIPYFKILPSQQASNLASKAFGWPQLITALIGGIIALPVIMRLEKRI
ncbi:MAG TPA: ECF transporter S component [Acetivibrio clariflavus]|nr:ECF transporter S component [Acetivibrio clariflavus]